MASRLNTGSKKKTSGTSNTARQPSVGTRTGIYLGGGNRQSGAAGANGGNISNKSDAKERLMSSYSEAGAASSNDVATRRSTGQDDFVPRYSGDVKAIYNPGGRKIRSALGGRVNEDGLVEYARNSDVDNDHYGKVQAMIDMAYGASPSARQNMPDKYYTVYDALQKGKGWNGYGLYADSPYMKSIWGKDALDFNAYNSLYAQGKVAGDGYLGSDGFVSGNGGGMADENGYQSVYNNGFQSPNRAFGTYLKRASEERGNAIDAATRATIDGLNGLKPEINQRAEGAAQQAYIAYEQGKRDLPQSLAASGLSGGASESSALALQTNYENGRNSIVQNRDNALNDLQVRIAQAQAQGDMQKAQALSDMYNQWAGMSMQQWQTMYNAQLQREMAALQQQNALEQQQRGFDNDKAMLDYKRQLEQQDAARKLPAGGNTARTSFSNGDGAPDFSGGSREILNSQAGGAIYVSGLGRLAPQEVLDELEAGRIRETFDSNGHVRYVKNG